MEGQLRPGLRADDDDDDDEEEEAAAVLVMALVLLLTVVLAEDGAEEEDGVVAGADGACSLADESTLSCIFSTLTAGVRLEEKVTEMKRAARRKLRVRNTEPVRNVWYETDVRM